MSLPESLKVSPQKPWFSWVLLGFCVLAVVVGLALPASKPPADSATAKASGETGDKIVKTIQKMSGGYLAHIKLQGPISMELDDSLFGQDKSNAVGVRDAINEAAEEDGVKGILLTINSPGGTVAMSQELNAAVTRARAKKPVVVYMGDTAASGGYYTACAADEIVANPGTLTASIGVIMSGLSFQELTNKLGIKANTIKSGKFKDLMSPYRTATADENTLLQGLINSSYQQFLGAVLDGRLRGVKDEAVKAAREKSIRAVADGRVVTGEQALAVGLVDTLGDVDVAHQHLDQRAKAKFKIGGKERLPLENFDSHHKLLEWLPIGMSGSINHAIDSALQGSLVGSTQSMVPFSVSHPKQPLWMME